MSRVRILLGLGKELFAFLLKFCLIVVGILLEFHKGSFEVSLGLFWAFAWVLIRF